MGSNTKDYQPMHANFGNFWAIGRALLKEKTSAVRKMAERAHKDFDEYIASRHELFDYKSVINVSIPKRR